jgi:hypothetical protein
MESFEGIHPTAVRTATALEAELQRMIGNAREPIRAYLRPKARQLPLVKRMAFGVVWWAVLKFVLPIIIQFVIELFMSKKKEIPTEECSPFLISAVRGVGRSAWEADSPDDDSDSDLSGHPQWSGGVD